MDQLINSEENGSIDEILEKPVILELEALTQSDKIFLIQALLLWIHHRRMTQGEREKFRHAILIEEAHHVLSGERRSLVGGQSVMEITCREIREFGESLIILDQHPSMISLPALGNTHTNYGIGVGQVLKDPSLDRSVNNLSHPKQNHSIFHIQFKPSQKQIKVRVRLE
jgi:hypothetical protein